MQSGKSSTNHIQSILNDHDFAPLRKFSFLVLVTPNEARLGRVLPATAQTAPAEAALSSRARLGCGGNGPSALPTHSLKGMNHVVSDDCDGDVNALLERPMKASLQSVIRPRAPCQPPATYAPAIRKEWPRIRNPAGAKDNAYLHRHTYCKNFLPV